MDERDQLQQAMALGERVRIVYLGGSQPGAYRELEVEEVWEDKIRAFCVQSDASKVFSIDKIEIVDGAAPNDASVWQPRWGEDGDYDDLQDVFDREQEALAELGWHVAYADGRLSLHRRFKNGKPLKGADVELVYEEFAWDGAYNYETGENERVNVRPRQRPYTVRAKGLTTRTYKEIAQAAPVFLRAAEELAPGLE